MLNRRDFKERQRRKLKDKGLKLIITLSKRDSKERQKMKQKD